MTFNTVDLDASHLAYVRQQLALHGVGGRLLGRRLLERGLGDGRLFPTVGVIGAFPSDVTLPGTRELTPEHVEEILDGLQLVLVGVWDADGYVFWEPAP